jgi:hemolysin activation/secretion protein
LKWWFPLAFVGLAGPAAAQDLLPRELPGEEAAVFRFEKAPDVHGWVADSSPVLLVRLERLSILGAEDGASRIRRDGVELSGMTVAEPKELAAELGGWIGRPLTESGLDRLTEVILRHYEDHGRPMNEVWVPPQDGAGGVLRVEVVEGRVGRLGFGRLEHFDEERLRKGIRVREGELLDGRAVQADLDWLSRNPFRRADLFVAPGEGVSADLLLGIEERRPWRAYAGYDNTGSEAVGENRWFGGFNWGNAFGFDHVLGYQFTVGDSLEDFHAHSMTWEIPVHRRHEFMRITAAWADVLAEETQDGVPTDAEGESWQVSALYGRQLRRAGDWTQEWRAGAEFKRADNFVIFGETEFPDTKVDVLQLRGEWLGGGPLWGGRADLQASLVASPGDVTARNGSEEFESFRTGADPSYVYARAEGSWVAPVAEDWSWRIRATAQLASGALLPTEQLGLGGYSTVRGYAERILLADGGYVVSSELRTPVIRAAEQLRPGGFGLQGLAFIDHALGWRDGDGTETLTGAGLGIRAAVWDSANLRLDVGWGLEDGDGAEIHAGVFASF